MQGDFYRKIQKPRWVKRITKNLFKTKRRGIAVIFSICVLTFLAFNTKGIVTRIRLESQRKEMAEKVRLAEEETKRLQAYIQALEGDKKTIEKVAREKYGMAKPGETIYKVERK